MTLVVEIPGELCGVLGLFHLDPKGIERPEIRAQSHGLDAITRLVIAQDILEVESEVETVDLTVSVGQSFLLEIDAITRTGKVALDQHRTACRHHDELTTTAHIRPVQVAQRLVADVIVEGETEKAHPASGAPREGQFAIEVGEVEGQPVLIDVAVQQLGTLLEITPLAGKQE